MFGAHWSTCSPDMTPFDCSQALVLDAICRFVLQNDATLVIPSYPQISRTPEIIYIYIYPCMNGFQFTIEEPEIAVGHFPTKLQFFRSNGKLARHFSEQKIAIRFYKRIGII
jgi:hypothetical protein